MYGDWTEYHKRYEQELAAGKTAFGVNCPHRPGSLMCGLLCVPLARAWRGRHGLPPSTGWVKSTADAGRRMAGL
jgi:hypothetical protein